MAQRLNKFANHLSSGQADAMARASIQMNDTSAQSKAFGTPGSKSDDDVVIVSALRTPIGKARKGAFKDNTPDDLLTYVLKATMEKTNVPKNILGDCVVGNVQMPGAYSLPARTAQMRAGLPVECSVRCVNRQCSSGLQAVASIASQIATGQIEAGFGCGVESMTTGGGVKGGELPPMNVNEVFQNKLAADCLTPMGTTSENVAERYGVTRAEQDQMAVDSHRKALDAQARGLFKDEIVPCTVVQTDKEGNEKTVTVTKDDGPRAGTTMEGLAKLRTVFKKDGTTTAGNASQVSDGAAVVLMMRRSKAKALGMPILGAFRGFKVEGCQPDEMGVGPAVAIPSLMKSLDFDLNNVDIFELNEAFASQAMYCVKKLNIPMEKVNPLGGAIALGHPLGCTGARQVATLMHHLRRSNQKYGVVSMCIGTGMGAAALFEAEK